MKRVMLVVACLLLVSAYCFALESGPSNKVGYVKILIASGTQPAPASTPFGLPFVFWDVPTGNVPTYGVESRKPSDICGTQTNPGTVLSADRIARQDNGRFAYRTTAGVWTGTLETDLPPNDMQPGRAYWYVNKSGVQRNLVLAGEADTTAAGIPGVFINPNSATAYSWRDPRDVPRNMLNLRAQGFTGGTITTSDRVTAQVGGQFFWFRTSDNTWQGTLAMVSPGQAYWIVNRRATGWTYTYLANGQQLSMPVGDPGMQQVTTPVPKAAKGVKSATD